MKKNNFSFTEKIPNWVYWVIGFFLVWYWLLPMFKNLYTKGSVILGQVPIPGSPGGSGSVTITNPKTGTQQTVNTGLCKQVANNCHEALHGYGWGLFEDEGKVIANLNKLTNESEVALTNQFYTEIDGNSLKDDVNDYLDISDQAKIRSWILANLS